MWRRYNRLPVRHLSSRFTAGAAGFLNLSQSFDRPLNLARALDDIRRDGFRGPLARSTVLTVTQTTPRSGRPLMPREFMRPAALVTLDAAVLRRYSPLRMTAPRSDLKAAAQVLLDLGPEILAMSDWQRLLQSGGVKHWERVAVKEATTQALAVTRRMWFDRLETWKREWWERRMASKRKALKREINELLYIEMELKRLRRHLHLRQPIEDTRRATRDRVRAFRERRSARA